MNIVRNHLKRTVSVIARSDADSLSASLLAEVGGATWQSASGRDSFASLGADRSPADGGQAHNARNDRRTIFERTSNKKTLFLVLAALIVFGTLAVAQQKSMPLPKLSVEIGKTTKPEDVSVTLQILFVMTILSLAPALLILTTAFTRIIVVFHFLKQAMGTPQMPPAQVLIGLALFLTFFVMAPVWNKVNEQALQPYLNNRMTLENAYQKGVEPIREFMFKQTREEDLGLFLSMAKIEKPSTRTDVPTYALIPAFAISELRTGFQIGFVLFIPFLIIDLVVASILMSMGMMMLPPVMISVPFKILLFILVDGWNLVVGSVVASFQ